MNIPFDEQYYLKSKLAQLDSAKALDANGKPYTLETLKQAITDAGLTPETHYQQYGRTEKLNPNAYFNEAEYLQAKLYQLKSVGAKDADGNDFTLDTLIEAIDASGLTPSEHYELYGSHETDAKGNLINPSNAFDANAYVAAKLYQLQTSGTAEEKAFWADKTAADVVDAIAESGISLVTHFQQYGATEANEGNVALVQTVPVSQRVENDPARAEITGQNVPSNYNAPTPAPAEVTAETAKPVTKPADLGGLTDSTVSPEVTVPSDPVPVPGDSDYVAPPANIVDTNDKPVVIVPSTTTDEKPQFGVLDTEDGTITGVDTDGKPTDTVIGKVDEDGTVTPVVPDPEPEPTPTPPTPTPPTPPTPEPEPTPPADTTAPTLTGASITTGENSSTIVLTFSEALNTALDVSSFTATVNNYKDNQGTDVFTSDSLTCSSATVSGTTVTLHVAETLAPNTAVILEYTNSTSANPIADIAGNSAEGFTIGLVKGGGSTVGGKFKMDSASIV